jgi:hypothetical protein
MDLYILNKHDLLNQDNLSGTLDDLNLKRLYVLEVMNFNSAERKRAHLKWMALR